jgi:hypothetical protein
MNRHAIRKHGNEYAVVFHSWAGVEVLHTGTKDACKVWLKEQIKFLKMVNMKAGGG